MRKRYFEDIDVLVFDFLGHDVRAVDDDGEIFYFAQDVRDMLGISDTYRALKRIDERDKLVVFAPLNDTFNHGKMTAVNKYGLAILACRSRGSQINVSELLREFY